MGELTAQQGDASLGKYPVSEVEVPDPLEQHHLWYVRVVPLSKPVPLKQQKHRQVKIEKDHRLLNIVLIGISHACFIEKYMLVHSKREGSYHEKPKSYETPHENGSSVDREVL
jgi:hypothetical protein